MKFEFSDRASYLFWRHEWRAEYGALSAKIRHMKRARKTFINRYRREVTPQGPVQELIAREPNPYHAPVEQWVLAGLRLQASFMMERLAEAKALSWSLKQSAKAA